MRKLEKNEILEKFKEKHSNNYDYSKFEYVGYHKKTIIICKIHGGFLQTPSKHIIGQGCKICNIKYSIGEIKDKLYKIHGDKYDFIFGDDVIDTRSKIKIKCNHGIKELQIRSLLQGQGCISCKGKKWTEFDLKNYLIKIHSELVYEDGFMNGQFLKVVCKEHGDFNIKKDRHLSGQGCPKCSKRKKYDQTFFIDSISKKFNNLSYDNCIFISFNKKVIITCTKHGDFETYPSYLLNGNGCKICRNENNSHSKEYFLQKCLERHPEIDHSILEYNGVDNNIKLICKKHGIFEQKAGYYLNYSKGCKYCNETKGEKQIRIYLENNNLKYKQQYKNHGFIFDFYIPDYNTYIEFNGRQHYEPIEFFGGVKSYNKQLSKDKLKDQILKNENIKLIKIGYWQINKVDYILKKELINEN
jgi:very-short-patch-repair endonuclease